MNPLKHRLPGIYLVVDPNRPINELQHKLREALGEGIAIVQIWDNWSDHMDQKQTIVQVCELCHGFGVPVVINNRWELLQEFPLDGVHFDAIPHDVGSIQQAIGRTYMAGITCTNDVETIYWAEKHGFDYLSFCSLFPSQTSTSCELVSFETIRIAREITSMPIFLAGGIQLENMHVLHDLPFDGVAVVSGIMGSVQPAIATKSYKQLLTKIQHETNHH